MVLRRFLPGFLLFLVLVMPVPLATGQRAAGVNVRLYIYETGGYWVYHNLFVINRTGFNNTEYIGFEAFRRAVSEWRGDALGSDGGVGGDLSSGYLETCLRVADEEIELRVHDMLKRHGVKFNFVSVWRDVVWIVLYRSSFERELSLVRGLRREIARIYMEVMASEPHEVTHPELGLCTIGWPREAVEAAINGVLKIVVEKPLADPYIDWGLEEYLRGEEPPQPSDLLDMSIPFPSEAKNGCWVDASTANREGILWFYVSMPSKNESVLRSVLGWIARAVRGGLGWDAPARVYVDIEPEGCCTPSSLVALPKPTPTPPRLPRDYRPPSLPPYILPIAIAFVVVALLARHAGRPR